MITLTNNKKTAKLWILAGAMLFAMAGTEGLTAQGAEWKAPRRAARKRNPMRKDARAVVLGKALYLKNCLPCHGNVGKGDGPASAALNPKPKDLTASHMDKQKDGELYWKIKNGKAPMPAFGGTMDRKEIWQVVSYIRSLKHGKPVVAAVPVKDAKASVSSLLDQYFGLQTQLKTSAWRPEARKAASKLEQTAKAMGDLVKGDKKQKALWKTQKAEVIRGARHLLAAKNADPVASFEVITKALDSLVATFGHAGSESITLFVCKMGQNKNGSVWLQKGEKISNPFPWSTKMPGCGEKLKSYAPPAKVKTHS